jgi:branched-chain amino acid transport system permease protein
MPKMTRIGWVTCIGMALLAILPPTFLLTGQEFYMDLATRLVILGIAAVSLNLILGFGGLVSFGHAAFIGLGAYSVAIPAHHATWGGFELVASYNGLFHMALAISIASLFALITGAISLRTKGVYFIMITMAFGQMAFFLFQSLDVYNGDDGLTIDVRSELPLFNLDSPMQLYILSYISLAAAMIIVKTIVNSRFGMVLQGAKGNNERMTTLGYNTYLYRLTAYVISGAMCGFAGFLLGNFTTFISPDMMHWTRSGELMFMVILGGAATALGPILGSSIFILMEEVLSSFTIFWHLPFGLMLIGVVLFIRGGIMGLFKSKGN